MSPGFVARNKVAIAGFAHSPILRRAERPLGVTALRTARAAISDAGLTPDAVDGFVSSSLLPTVGGHAIQDGVSVVTSDWLARHLGAPARYIAGFSGVGQITGSVMMAVNAVASGSADYVLLHRALHNPAGKYHNNSRATARGMQQWTMPQGFFGPLASIALPYNEYLQRYGAQRESMAAVATEARKNGSRIPWSYWAERPLGRDEYLSAPTLFDPICQFDCDIPVDGVAVFVLTSAERAADGPNRPVYVSGFGSSPPPPHRLPMHWTLDDIIDGGAVTARHIAESSGLKPSEIDLPQVYDGFSPFVWFWLEALGICAQGEAHRFVAGGGIDSDRHGAVPALSGGGALGNGRMHGIPQMLECYLQLAGRAGERQRDGVTTALACHSSPHFGGAVAYTNEAY